ncbi:MAG: hypothetical protein GYA24_03000 [Candidatus Lokiarchaeota archaeon]|nr:hypothetical protein [Candidatus Lokiarchaeota archaeon]
MSSPPRSKSKYIKNIVFTDGHVWIHGTVKRFEGDRVEVDDGTGVLSLDIRRDGNADDGTMPTVVQGTLTPGVMVRVIGDVVANTDKTFTFTPSIIQNLDELGVDKVLFEKIRSLEHKLAGDA